MGKEISFGRSPIALWKQTIFLIVIIVIMLSIDTYNKTPIYVIWALLIAIVFVKSWSVMQESITLWTDSVIVKKGRLFSSVEDIKYTKINNIRISMFATIEIFTGKDAPVTFSRLENCQDVKRLLDERISAVANAGERQEFTWQTDNIDQIEKISRLYKEGILTKEEFEAKKKKLLDI